MKNYNFFKILLFINCFNFFEIYPKKIEFVILITSFNNEDFYYKNLESAVNQKTTYPFSIIYINDASTDKTQNLVEEYIKNKKLESKITLINNKINVGPLENQYNAIQSIDDNKIIISLDGDDYLANEKVLERVGYEYEFNNAWITFGQFKYFPQGNLGACNKIPEEIMKTNKIRSYPCAPSHLKTFYAGLFKKIKLEDLKFENKFISGAPDLAIMFPMLEMACQGHIKFIPDVLYIYNYQNPLSEHTKHLSHQIFMDKYLRNQKPYEPLSDLNF